MQTSWQGVDETEALGRLQALGPNALEPVRSRGFGRIVIGAVREPMFLLLVVARFSTWSSAAWGRVFFCYLPAAACSRSPSAGRISVGGLICLNALAASER